MSTTCVFLCAVLFVVIGSNALPTAPTTVAPSSSTEKSEQVKNIEKLLDEAEAMRRMKVASRIKDTLKTVKQMTQPDGLIEKAVRTNFLHSLYQMANNTAITGTNVSRAAGTLIRGFVQDQFNLASIAFYFPRLIFLGLTTQYRTGGVYSQNRFFNSHVSSYHDKPLVWIPCSVMTRSDSENRLRHPPHAPSQFIETLRLIRANQIRAPMNMNEAIDTLINFASMARESQITMNLATPFLSIWPNIFRGSELLATEVLYSVFQWLGPISPTDVSAGALEGLWNRWDIKASTTSRYDYDKKWSSAPNAQPDTINGRPLYETEKVVKVYK